MAWQRANLEALAALLDEYAYVPRAPEQRRLANWLRLIGSGRLAAEEWSSDRALTRARRANVVYKLCPKCHLFTAAGVQEGGYVRFVCPCGWSDTPPKATVSDKDAAAYSYPCAEAST